MLEYKKMYHKLFNAMTDAIDILQNAQLDMEEEYINSTENDNVKSAKFQLLEKMSETKEY